MHQRELAADQRIRLFNALIALDQKQGGWDQLVKMLNQGQQAAERARLSELAEQFERGQSLAIDGLKKTGKFLGWELQLIQLGLAAGNVQESYRRLVEHYLLIRKATETLKRQLRLPLIILAFVLLLFLGLAVYEQRLTLVAAAGQFLLSAIFVATLLAALNGLVSCYRGERFPPLVIALINRLPGIRVVIAAGQKYHYMKNICQCLEGGLSLNQSLKIAACRLPVQSFVGHYLGVHRKVLLGNKLSLALADSGVLEKVAVAPMTIEGASAAQAQAHLTEAVYIAYINRLLYYLQWLPQLMYFLLPVVVLLNALVI